MNRIVLTAWLLAPIVIVGAMYMMIPKKAQRLGGGGATSAVQPAAVKPADAKPADTKPAEPKPAAAADDKAIQPEFLPQGAILVVEDTTGLATNDSPIYVAGSFNGWNPGDDKWKLTRRSDLKWQVVIPQVKNNAKIEFKFTRGSWDMEQLNEDLTVPGNNMLPPVSKADYPAGGKQPVFDYKVVKWGDQRPDAAVRPDLNPYYTMQVTGTVKRLEVGGGGVPFKRDLLVWLPPGYDKPENAARKYPVLYLMDGQNIFMKMPGTPAEWSVDETATRLIDEGKVEPLIIVGVPHADKGRMSEYTFMPLIDGAEPRGEAFIRWMMASVMPRVERAFRVKTGPEYTGIGGASLGGLISLYAGCTRPDVFGLVLAESTPLVMKDKAAMRWFAEQKKWPRKMVFGMGGREAGTKPESDKLNKQYADSATEFYGFAKDKVGGNLMLNVDPEAVHNEEAWAKRFGAELEYLYPAKK